MVITRRAFLAALAALPLVGQWMPKTWVTTDGIVMAAVDPALTRTMTLVPLDDAATIKRLAEHMHQTQVDAFREAHKP